MNYLELQNNSGLLMLSILGAVRRVGISNYGMNANSILYTKYPIDDPSLYSLVCLLNITGFWNS